MNYHNITTDDMLNGSGLRTVLWVAGCEHHCVGCHNAVTWNPNGGIPFDMEAKKELFHKTKPNHISGVTFSGGDPLFPKNRDTITALAKELKETFPQKTIWLYTGYLWEEIVSLPVIAYIDVLVDGKYIEALRNPLLHWKGSSNQRVILVPLSLQTHTIQLYKEEEKFETNWEVS